MKNSKFYRVPEWNEVIKDEIWIYTIGGSYQLKIEKTSEGYKLFVNKKELLLTDDNNVVGTIYSGTLEEAKRILYTKAVNNIRVIWKDVCFDYFLHELSTDSSSCMGS